MHKYSPDTEPIFEALELLLRNGVMPEHIEPILGGAIEVWRIPGSDKGNFFTAMRHIALFLPGTNQRGVPGTIKRGPFNNVSSALKDARQVVDSFCLDTEAWCNGYNR